MAKVELNIDFPLYVVEHYTALAEETGCGVEDYMSDVLAQKLKTEIAKMEATHGI